MAALTPAVCHVRPARLGFPYIIAAVSIMLAFCTLAFSQQLKVLHTFNGGQGDGYNPSANVTVDQNGVIYGTTAYGGNLKACVEGCGEVFQVAPTKLSTGEWEYSAIYEFNGNQIGAGYMDSALTLDSKGRLYGVDASLFRLTPPSTPGAFWHYQDLYDLNGFAPTTPLLIDSTGALYGVTSFGGSSACGPYGCGTVLQFVPAKKGPWTENVLYQFTGGADGAYPASIVLDSATGTLYGIAEGGGINSPNCASSGGCGTLFKLEPGQGGAWTFTVLYSFTGVHDGGPYANLVPDSSGRLYGLASRGQAGEEVFRLTPLKNGMWGDSLIHFFSSQDYPVHYCGYPPSSLTAGTSSGVLYGAVFGDIDLYFGALFQVMPPADGKGVSYTTLWDFNESGPDLNPNGVVQGPDGALYGTTNGGDSTGGTVFRLELPSQAPWPPTDFCY